jgi:hypothetical protein
VCRCTFLQQYELKLVNGDLTQWRRSRGTLRCGVSVFLKELIHVSAEVQNPRVDTNVRNAPLPTQNANKGNRKPYSVSKLLFREGVVGG